MQRLANLWPTRLRIGKTNGLENETIFKTNIPVENFRVFGFISRAEGVQRIVLYLLLLLLDAESLLDVLFYTLCKLDIAFVFELPKMVCLLFLTLLLFLAGGAKTLSNAVVRLQRQQDG